MKRSPTHLPKNKRDELDRIVVAVRQRCDDVEMMVLFGSYARGNYKEEADLKPERKSGHKSDYDILVVTGEKRTATDVGLWQNVGAECEQAGLSAHVRIVAHDIQELNIKLAEGQYFYSDAIKEGCPLYDSGNCKLAGKRKLTPAEKKRIAQDHFDHWIKKASDFWRHFEFDMQEQEHTSAAFMLHQATEASYKAILLVFTNYLPHEHYLGVLGRLAAKNEPALGELFPVETEKDRRRFELFDYAYIGARYDPAYWISEEDLTYLSARVKRLLDLTEKACKAKIGWWVVGSG